jgi:N-acetyl-anhydromuramyl-L-alanine amidase AmpD
MAEKLYTAAKVAPWFQVSAKTILAWETKGKFPKALPTPGGQRRFKGPEIRAELAKYGYPIPEELEPKDPGGEVLAQEEPAASAGPA